MDEKPHIVCIPAPAQGHINPMMQVANLMHSRGFFITFVHTDFTYRRLLRSKSGEKPLECLDGFHFEVISDGLPPNADMNGAKNLGAYIKSVRENCPASFRDLLRNKLHRPADGHRVTCIVSDAFMTFTLEVAEEMGVPDVVFCPTGACGLMAFAHYHELMRRGLTPLKDESCISSGYLDTTIINWIPGMGKMRLRDLGSFLQTTDPNDFHLNNAADEAQKTLKASMIIFNTFDDLEHEVLHAFQSMVPAHICTVGPLLLLCRQLLPDNGLKSIKSSIWKEETECLKWLDGQEAASVIYVNYGSVTIVTEQQLLEFAWGIANSNHPFLWVIRPDLVTGGRANLPKDLMDKIEEKGMLVTWCPQEEVLAHPSIAFFLSHCGWNSTLESISFGVPMLCWPFFADQQTFCKYACKEWGVGMEIDNNVKREVIGALIKEFMQGEKGKEMKEKALNWKRSADVATKEGGSSRANFELLIDELLQLKDN